MLYFKIPLQKELMVSEANNRDHWRIKTKRRNLINFMLKQNLIYKPLILTPCIVTLTRISPRKLDYDNMVFTFKGVRDYISDYLIPGYKAGRADDDEKEIEWIYRQTRGKPKEYAIEVMIVSKEV